jgi:hypothetical protein
MAQFAHWSIEIFEIFEALDPQRRLIERGHLHLPSLLFNKYSRSTLRDYVPTDPEDYRPAHYSSLSTALAKLRAWATPPSAEEAARLLRERQDEDEVGKRKRA